MQLHDYENSHGQPKVQSPCPGKQSIAGRICCMVLIMLLLPVMLVAQTITFSAKNGSLRTVFEAIEKQTGYDIMFDAAQMDADIQISIEAKNEPLEKFLNKLFAKIPFTYSKVNTTIVVHKKEQKGNVPPSQRDSIPDGRVVDGGVYDKKTGLSLSGASVVIKGSGKGTQTDSKGKFTLKQVRTGDVLSFSMIGYEPFEYVIKADPQQLFFPMSPTSNEMDVAVVQAYGITSKRLSTGSITKVTAAEIEKQPVMNPLISLQGRVPGLVVTPTSGQASAPVKVEIRGRNTINPNSSSEPLYVIDGTPLTVLDVPSALLSYNGSQSPGFIQGGVSNTGGQSPLFNLNPADIESIEVLKDGDATAIYGSRAANGVILITTKRGKPGKTSLNLSAEQGIAEVSRFWKFLDTERYIRMREEAFRNDGIAMSAFNAGDVLTWSNNRYTDWQKEFLSKGKRSSVSARLSGGDSRTSFNLSTNYQRTTEILNHSGDNQRATVNLNLGHRSVNDKLNIRAIVGFGWTKVDAININSPVALAPNAPPVFDDKYNLNFQEWNDAFIFSGYPFSTIMQPSVANTNNLTAQFNVNYEIIRGLFAGVDFGYTSMQNSTDWFMPSKSMNPMFNLPGMATFGNTRNNNTIIEPQLRYNAFIGKGNLTVQAGATLQSTTTRGITTLASGYTNDDLIHSVSNAEEYQTAEGYSQYKYAAIFGRINYNWENKYIINLNMRRDGSSRFGEGRQFGNFGSAGFAWIASEEQWMQKVLPSWISFLKLRASYGVTGNDGIGDYKFMSQWSSFEPNSTAIQLLRYNNIKPYIPLHAVNMEYRWETVRKSEIGAALSFLNDRISLEWAWYRNRSDNQLIDFPMPVFTGFPNVIANGPADIANYGHEISLLGKLIEKTDLSVAVNFNIGTNRNKLLSYPNLEASPYSDRYKIGYSVNTVFVYRYLGVDPQTGRYNFEDYNGDGIVRTVPNIQPGTMGDDRYIGIDLNPAYSGGFGTQVRYKRFTGSLLFTFRKQMALSVPGTTVAGLMGNILVEHYENRWTKPGDNAKYARLSTRESLSLRDSDGAYIDASFLRLNNVSLGYSLGDKLLKPAGMQSCNLFINAQNIFHISNYDGIDPELHGLGLPNARTISAGISFTF